MKGPIWTIAVAVCIAVVAVTKIAMSFSGKYMGKEAGFTLFETGNLIAIAALVVASFTFIIATMVLLWRIIRARTLAKRDNAKEGTPF
jgi:hypothetical protein